jgi:hypothetical protein
MDAAIYKLQFYLAKIGRQNLRAKSEQKMLKKILTIKHKQNSLYPNQLIHFLLTFQQCNSGQKFVFKLSLLEDHFYKILKFFIFVY